MRATLFHVFLLIPFFAGAQKYPKYVRFDTDNGLTQNTVWTVSEDKYGRIWFGSPGEIKIYNGFDLKTVPGITEIILRLHSLDSAMYCVTSSALYKINVLDFSYKKVEFSASTYYIPRFDSNGVVLYNPDGEARYAFDYTLQKRPISTKTINIDINQLLDINMGGHHIYGGARGLYIDNGNCFLTHYCTRFVKYSPNRVFVSSHAGLIELTSENGNISVTKHFPDWRMEEVFVDHNKNLWVGTADFGVFMIHRNALQSKFYTKQTPDGFPISCWRLFTVGNRVYTATSDGVMPVECLDYSNDPLYQITRGTAFFSAIEGDSFVLLGSRNKGIIKIEDNKLQQVYFSTDTPLDNLIIQIERFKDGFLASSKHSLILLNRKGNFVSKQPCNFDQKGSYVMDFYPSPNGWVAARTTGVVFLNTDLKVDKQYVSPYIKVISMVRQYRNKWWGTAMDAGLFTLDNEQIVSQYFPDKHLFTLTNVGDSNLWITSVTSLYQYSDSAIRPFGNPNGIAIKEFNQGACLKTKNGVMFYGGVNGVLKFHPDSLSFFPNIPSIIIYHNEKKIYSENTIQLNFDQAEINLRVEPVCTSDTNLYRIELGIDTEFIEITKPTTVRFAVPFRKSDLQLRITNLTTKKTTTTSYPVIRAIPFWKQTWFLAVGILTFLLLIVGIASSIGYIRTKRRLKIEQAENRIKEERLRLSKELHDNIGARLTHIISSLDIEMYRNKNEYSAIESINVFARETMSQLRETIWAVNEKAIFFSEFSARIEQYVEQINELTSTTIRFSSTNLPDFELNPSQTINYYRIVQEAINNAVKYASASNINVSMHLYNEEIHIQVADNGLGFDVDNTRFGTGLKGMKARADEVNSKLHIHSSNLGTNIILILSV